MFCFSVNPLSLFGDTYVKKVKFSLHFLDLFFIISLFLFIKAKDKLCLGWNPVELVKVLTRMIIGNPGSLCVTRDII